ncbi:sensor domain-containing diguanylate cyclase [Caproiciproducens faecalis]|uniref:Diguanylate cyclase n=1 Tax=Caproiciproducens faecalis TaxID=2820301 RepID=A0ABS7DNE7_9FIRM|nr:diguanylate cyclase [Caproiciproducens faecalis]MBW7572827.1 diguanylate cyclase [Caproiciproducens faecalis]
MKIRKYLATLLAVFSILPLVLVMGFSVLSFQRNTSQLLQANVKATATQTANNLDQFFNQRKMALEVASDLPGVKELLLGSNAEKPDKALEQYRTITINTFKTMTAKQTINGQGNSKGNFVRRSSLINRKGTIIASDDSRLIGQPSFINVDMRTVPAYGLYLSDLMHNDDFIDGQNYFVIAVPIYMDGIYEGFIQSSIDMIYLDSVSSQTFMETGHTLISDGRGRVASGNLFDGGQKMVSTDEMKLEGAFSGGNLEAVDLDRSPTGVINFWVGGKEKFGYYSRLAGKDWMIVSAVDTEELIRPFQSISEVYFAALLVLAAALIICAYVAANRFLNPLRDMSEEFVRVEKGDYQTRLPVRYQGEFAEIAAAFNHLMEKIKEDTDVLKVSEARYALIMEETNQVVFEWDILENHIYHTVYWTNKFGFSTVAQVPGSDIPNFQQVHPADQELMAKLFHKIKNGGQPGPTDVRMKDISGHYIWCTVNIKILYDENKQPYRAIGLIVDTDHQKKMIQKLESKSKMDLLTQLYNKVTTESMIEECLKTTDKETLHGLIIVDIDNFKDINDTLGHIFGDAVLRKVSTDIKHLFRATDIVGRTGGDEFIIFIKEIDCADLLVEKMSDICEIFHCAYTGEDETYKISASVGGVIYPYGGATFEELYRHADEALYCSKKNGKDKCSLYEMSSLRTAL